MTLMSVGDVFLRGKKIVGVGKKPAAYKHDKTIDATGLLVLPGLVDLCARLREPGEVHKATIASETRAAASGGITRLICPPDTTPVVDTPAMAAMIQDRAAACGFARVHPLGALTVGLGGERLADMALLADAGCVAFSNARAPVTDTLVMRRAMQYAATYRCPVVLSPQDFWLRGNGVVHEGEVSARLGLPAIPVAAETAGVARDLALIETSGVRAHFDLLSTARAVEMLSETGLPVTAGVAVHQLHFTEKNIGAFDTRYKVLPPLRTEADRTGLLRGVADGVIGAICSDHQPQDADAKIAPFAEAAPGVSGVETLLPKTMQLVADGALSLATAITALTINPARIAGLDGGHLSVGGVADLCLYDDKMKWALDAQSMQSDGKNSPWFGEQITGKVVATVIGGKVVYQDDSVVVK